MTSAITQRRRRLTLLNRPEQLNALNPAMMSQLAHHIDGARADNRSPRS
jgi:enoyl-CoA hydratase/carnithine racemase